MGTEYSETPHGVRVAHRGPDGVVEFVEYLPSRPSGGWTRALLQASRLALAVGLGVLAAGCFSGLH